MPAPTTAGKEAHLAIFYRQEMYAQKLIAISTRVREVETRLIGELYHICNQLHDIGSACTEATYFFDNLRSESAVLALSSAAREDACLRENDTAGSGAGSAGSSREGEKSDGFGDASEPTWLDGVGMRSLSMEEAEAEGGRYFVIDDEEEYGRIVGELIRQELEVLLAGMDIDGAAAERAQSGAEEAGPGVGGSAAPNAAPGTGGSSGGSPGPAN